VVRGEIAERNLLVAACRDFEVWQKLSHRVSSVTRPESTAFARRVAVKVFVTEAIS
jgi:hypothetical protein